jgi:hypothetical protein
MKTIVHVNQPRLAQYLKSGERGPVITVKDYKHNRYGDVAELQSETGEIVARVCADLDHPRYDSLVWMEFPHGVEMSVQTAGGMRIRRFKGPVVATVEKMAIRQNGATWRDPILVLYTQAGMFLGWAGNILDSRGEVACKFIYSPSRPQSCGARAWIETQHAVDVHCGEGVAALETAGTCALIA